MKKSLLLITAVGLLAGKASATLPLSFAERSRQ